MTTTTAAPVAAEAATDRRYTIISADCHAGGDLQDYRAYLDPRFRDDFDAWAGSYQNPFTDLISPGAYRNWDSDARLKELESDGITAEVIFPNTVPPFFPDGPLLMPPNRVDFERRWAGLRAHNRWLADFCRAVPGRRAGVAQIMLNDVDAAVAEIRWAVDAGLTGGILLPGVPPGAPEIPPLYAPDYDPIWAVCEELGVPVNHHAGSAVPDYGDYPASTAMFIIEVSWFAHRALWQLMFGGVFERFPGLTFVLTEQAAGWLPSTLQLLDRRYEGMKHDLGSPEAFYGAKAMEQMSKRPSEYFARNCHLGASFLKREEALARDAIGVERIMWGSDYPHIEGTYPHTREALRQTFFDVDEKEVAAMLAGNAARLYGFDLAALAPVAARIGPSVADSRQPLGGRPEGSHSQGFDDETFLRPW